MDKLSDVGSLMQNEEQLEETSDDAVAKIDTLFRDKK
jgi:hypothetical protein